MGNFLFYRDGSGVLGVGKGGEGMNDEEGGEGSGDLTVKCFF